MNLMSIGIGVTVFGILTMIGFAWFLTKDEVGK